MRSLESIAMHKPPSIRGRSMGCLRTRILRLRCGRIPGLAILLLGCLAGAPAGEGTNMPGPGERSDNGSEAAAGADGSLIAMGLRASDLVLRRARSATPARAAEAARVWDHIRWISPVTGERMDVAPLIGSFADPRVRGAWESFIARYGADAVYAVAGMRQTAGQQENAIRAFSLLLSAVPAVDVARSMVAPDAGAARDPFRELLAGAADRVPDPPILIRICEILLLLWWYPDVPDVAARAYGASRNDAFVGFAAAGIRRGGDTSIPADALRRLVASRARPDRDTTMVFWVRVARETGHMASIRGILRPADAHPMKPSDAATLAENLGAADEVGEIDRLFSDAPSPASIYLRARFGSSPEGVAGISAGVSSAIEALDPESAWFSSEAFDLGELMERFGDAGPAERVWRRLIERPDDRTVYTANARLRLARRAEARGDLPGALEMCEEALSISRDLGAESTVTGPGGGRGTEWLMRVILDLRRKIGEQSRMSP